VRSMVTKSLLLLPGQTAALLLLCCACLLASAATLAAPCHEVALPDAPAHLAGQGKPASAAMELSHDAHRVQHPASQHDTRQGEDSATGVLALTPMHHAGGATSASHCCEGGGCAMDCGCAAVALIAVPAPGAPPARSALLATTAVRQPSLAPGKLLRPPIPA
jgi:hypothetical protein